MSEIKFWIRFGNIGSFDRKLGEGGVIKACQSIFFSDVDLLSKSDQTARIIKSATEWDCQKGFTMKQLSGLRLGVKLARPQRLVIWKCLLNQIIFHQTRSEMRTKILTQTYIGTVLIWTSYKRRFGVNLILNYG